MKQEPTKKPFAFRPSPDALRQFKDATPEAKLNWLEDASRFVNDFVSPEKRSDGRRSPGGEYQKERPGPRSAGPCTLTPCPLSFKPKL